MACPICDRETDAKFRPFCSKRCADIDLAKWLSGSYAIPSQDEDDAENLAEALDDAAKNGPERLH
ncbi:MAG: DNA gyrase inhibitor YacG [Paracoccaceae bacterium]|uniref:DNA gyrase inhibitor YacG n=1 Tax=Yoonia sp. TaxID=2212373 RepID=UPI0022011340|nr:DNA gyrase inhibitor YacG [Rhodobacteraceae bacterium S2214]